MVRIRKAIEDNCFVDLDDIREDIQEEPLSLEVRNTAWRAPHLNPEPPDEYCILLGWGGPAVRIVGDLNRCGEPETAVLQFQDWFTSWEPLKVSQEDENVLLEYARCFYFEG